MWLLVPRFLPNRDSMADLLGTRKRMKFFTEVVVPEGSPLIGSQVMDVALFKREGMRVIDVLRGDEILRRQFPDVALAEGDRVVLRTEMQELLGLKDSNKVTLVDRVGSKTHDHGRGADPARLPAGRPLARQPAAAAALRRLSARGAPPQPEHRPAARRGGGAGRRHAAARGRAGRHPPAGRRRGPRRPERDHRPAVQARARAAGAGWCSRRSCSARRSTSRRSRSWPCWAWSRCSSPAPSSRRRPTTPSAPRSWS